MSPLTAEEHRFQIGLPDRGRRAVQTGQKSTVESIIYGKEPESARCTHRDQDLKQAYRDCAGQPSANKQGQMGAKTRRPVLNYSSQLMQDVESARTPHEEFMNAFSDRAGARNAEARFRPMKAPGVSNPESMHEIIFGRSGVENQRGTRAKSMSAAGKKTDPEIPRQESVSVVSARWTSSSVQLGDSKRASSPGQDKRFQDHAGRKPERTPQRSSCLRSVSAVDKLLYGRDLSHAKEDALVEYANKHAGHAGFMWKLKPKSSESTEAGPLTGWDAGTTDPPDLQAQDAPGKCVFEPPLRKSSDAMQSESVATEALDFEASGNPPSEAGPCQGKSPKSSRSSRTPSVCSSARPRWR